MELRTFGLTKATQTTRKIVSMEVRENEEIFTEKMYRFNYWLGYNNLIKDKINVEYLGPVETNDDKE